MLSEQIGPNLLKVHNACYSSVKEISVRPNFHQSLAYKSLQYRLSRLLSKKYIIKEGGDIGLKSYLGCCTNIKCHNFSSSDSYRPIKRNFRGTSIYCSLSYPLDPFILCR